MLSGYDVVFKNGECVISHGKTGVPVMTIRRTKNNMFPMLISGPEQANVVTKNEENYAMWHQRYGHLSQRGLQILNHESMVIGLPDLSSTKQCEACVLGKQTRVTFPLEKA